MSDKRRDELAYKDSMIINAQTHRDSNYGLIEFRQFRMDGFKSGYDAALADAKKEIELLQRLLIERNQNAVLSVENYNRINGLRNDANERADKLAEALEKVVKRNDIAEAVLDYYGDCAMALDEYRKATKGDGE